ncbi:MAG TPA: response regulator [Candidatus Saccharimonadales bacterium]
MANVLLIEPDKVLGGTYQQALRLWGYEVTHAFSAQEAINAADKARPDVVVLELQLIGHDGIEFLQEFRSYPEWQDVPVVVLSHLTRELLEQSRVTLARDYGVYDCLYKPRTTLSHLQRAINGVLGI